MSGSSQNQITHATGAKPKITKVSRIKPEQYQKIVISGSGFGDKIAVNVWNAQDDNGPATKNTKVK